MKRFWTLLISMFCTSLIGVGHATADEGRYEISQACALVGCFAGDAPGFPVTITSPGSYVLTSDLEVALPFASGVVGSTNFISLDLAGFAIRSSTQSNSRGVQLAGSGSEVQNGHVSGFGITCVEVGGGSIVRAVETSDCDFGISSSRGLIVASVARNSSDRGINSSRSVVRGNIASENGGAGFTLGAYSVARSNTARMNNSGFRGSRMLVVGNTAVENVGDGARNVGSMSSFIRNTLSENGGNGVDCTGDCLVRENSFHSNGSVGIAAPAASGVPSRVIYADNVIVGNGFRPISPLTGTFAPISRSNNYCAGPNTIGAFCP